MKIECNVLDRQFNAYQIEYEAAALRVLRSGWYVLGKEVEQFEQNFASFTGAKYCIGLNSGLDALILGIRALGIGPGDEVLVPANTYIASIMGITENGATPVFVEPDAFYNIDAEKIADLITPNTKAILPVHLYGQACNMHEIRSIAEKYHLFIIEDCAQSHGACFEGQMTGTFGDIGCFSFYPTKNLGAFGDGGAVITSDAKIAEKMQMLRNYGSKVKYHNEIEGVNSRLDEIQAALLSVKLVHLNELTNERQNIAGRYLIEIKNPEIFLPETRKGADHVYHQFVVRCPKRNDFQKYLSDRGIKTLIHYPIPPHLAECYAYLGYKLGNFPITEQYSDEIVSLPMYNGMTDEEIDYVINTINLYSDYHMKEYNEGI
jgi:dTDP-4-amino-4,6-dideoxygalactose transaminase